MLKLYGWWYGLCAHCAGVERAHNQPAALSALELHVKEGCKKA